MTLVTDAGPKDWPSLISEITILKSPSLQLSQVTDAGLKELAALKSLDIWTFLAPT